MQQPEPDVVYHYTSLSALLSIIESESIWATNLRYLNDVGEYTYCLDLMRKRTPHFLQSHATRYIEPLRQAFTELQPKSMSDYPYAASFSLLSDSLPQWRSYCPSGNGVSLGFRVNCLRESFLDESTQENRFVPYISTTLQSVAYISEESTAAIDALLNACLDQMAEWDKFVEGELEEQKDLPADERWMDASALAAPYALKGILEKRAGTVKHKAFSNENEYRLLITDSHYYPHAIRYRSSRTTLVPYLNLKMPAYEHSEGLNDQVYTTPAEYFLASVTVGPTANPELTIDSLQNIFLAKNVAVAVKASTVPFRDL